VEAVDLVTVDADALFCHTLLRTLALASGLAQEEHAEAAADVAAGPAQAPPRHLAMLQGRLLLVAEDNETNRLVIEQQLRLVGFAADLVADGRQALQAWRSGDYALVLTDLHMPEMDGYALAAAIRAEEGAGLHTPIIALTANALRDEELRCMAAGMDAYLSKPVRLLRLKTAIETCLGPAVPGKALRAERAATAPAVDLRVLVALVGDDPEVVGKVLQAFRNSAVQVAAELTRGVRAGAAPVVAAAAHRLKSGARSIGAQRLADLCVALEEAAQAGPAETLAALLPNLETELERVLRALDSRPAAGGR
jgi:CheY-like chemotaxis protein